MEMDIYKQLTKKLIEKNLSISTMESCTAGQIVSLLTDIEGSSAVVKGGHVVYCNEAKIMAGVPREVIETYGVYSKETAIDMAKACRKNFDSNIGIGITGTFGNVDPNNADSEAGKVYFAIDINGEIYVYERILERQETRHDYKLLIAKEIACQLELLLK